MADDDEPIAVREATEDEEPIAVREGGPVTGVTGPGGFVDQDARPSVMAPSEPRRMGQLESAVIGAEMGIPLAPAVLSGMETVTDVAKQPTADILATYQKNRAHRQQLAQQSQRDNPWTHGIASATTGIGTALAAAPLSTMGAVGAGGIAARNLILDALAALGQTANEGKVDTRNASKNMMLGYGLGGAARLVGKGVQTAGEILEGGQNLKDDIAGWLGKSQIGKMIGASGDELDDAMKSSRVINLEQRIKDAENFKPTPVEMSQADAMEHFRGESLPYRLATAAKEGRADIYDTGFQGSPVDFGDDMARMHAKAVEQGKQGRYPSNWTTEDIRMAQLKLQKQASAPQFAKTKASGVPKNQSGPSAVPEDLSEALATETARHADYQAATSAAGDQMRTDAAQRARTLLQQMRDIESRQAGDAMEKAKLDKAAAGASEQLGNIRTGQAAFGKAAGVLGGASAGYAAGGVPGAMLGALGGANKAIASPLLKGIDMAGAYGQRLARTASIIEKVAMQDNAMGRMAQWALSAEGPNAIARMAILADMPEFQEDMATE